MQYKTKTYRPDRLDRLAYRLPEIAVGVLGILAILAAHIIAAAAL